MRRNGSAESTAVYVCENAENAAVCMCENACGTEEVLSTNTGILRSQARSEL